MRSASTQAQQSCTATKEVSTSATSTRNCARGWKYSSVAASGPAPGKNGFMERWFGNFKLELGTSLKGRKDVSQLHEAVALKIYYYNTKRIHLSLGMSPAAYAASLMPA